MKPALDCLVIGYNDDTDTVFAQLLGSSGGTPEYRIFRRDAIRVAGKALSYIDIITYFRGLDSKPANATSQPFYHVCGVPNLAAIYLCNFLLKRNLSADFIGFFNGEKSKLFRLLTTREVTTVAITTTFYEKISPVREIISTVRRLSPRSKIIVGGPLIQNLRNSNGDASFSSLLTETGADLYILESQGENSLARLVSAVKYDQPPETIPNVYTFINGRWLFSKMEKENNNLEDTVIDWKNFSKRDLGPSVQLRTARSCAYSCAFCDYPFRAGKLTWVEPRTVVNEIRQLLDLGVSNFVFVDDTFNVPEERFREICSLIISEKMELNWFSYFRCSSVNRDDTFDLAAKSGCKGVFLGIESGDPDVLKNMSKAASVEKYRHGIRRLKELGIITFASFIAGFPGETQDTIENTCAFINETQPHLFRMEPWWYNKSAPIQEHVDRYGIEGPGGYDWKHSTMDIYKACDSVDWVFDRVHKSLWCPQQSFSFWALPYLLGIGMSMDDILTYHKLCHIVLRAQLRGEMASEQLYDLRVFVQSLRLAPSGFSREIQ